MSCRAAQGHQHQEEIKRPLERAAVKSVKRGNGGDIGRAISQELLLSKHDKLLFTNKGFNIVTWAAMTFRGQTDLSACSTVDVRTVEVQALRCR